MTLASFAKKIIHDGNEHFINLDGRILGETNIKY